MVHASRRPGSGGWLTGPLLTGLRVTIHRMTIENPPAPRDEEGTAVWVQYSKDRYDAAEKRITDFRGWARQLAAAIAVVVGLEAALLSQLARLGDAFPYGMAVCLCILLGSIAFQLVLLGKAVRKGYVGQELLGPESPVVVADHVSGEAATRRMIGAYYAKASDASHVVAEAVVRDVGAVARAFTASLWLLFSAMVLTGGLLAVSSLARKPMADTPPANGPAPSNAGPSTDAPAKPAAASPTSPAQSPLLITPTPGRTETRAQEPAVQKLTATPTPGQRITEGKDGKRE